MQLLTSSKKTQKSEQLYTNWINPIMYLAPHKASGKNLCAYAHNAGCIDACLNTSGRGRMSSVQNARIARAKFFVEHRSLFMLQLVGEIAALQHSTIKSGKRLAIRLNGTSDIPFENIPVLGHDNIMAMYPDVMFYDYTKNPNRVNLPKNYSLTFSHSGRVPHMTELALKMGLNVAAVFRHTLPANWQGLTVIDGTRHDLRFMDDKQVVVGLLALGKARKDKSGFVVD